MALDYNKDGKIAVITFNRPDVMNAIDRQAFMELRQALESFRDDPEVWVAILTGAGEKAFSAGADLKAMKETSNEEREAQAVDRRALSSGLALYKPLIGAINGYCLGGGLEMALLCDIRIAAEHARFGMPEVMRSIVPDNGGTQRLARLVGWANAAEILFVGEPINAQEAHRIGLVNRVVPADKLMSSAMQMAQIMCQGAPLSLRYIKEAMARGVNADLEDGLIIERQMAANIHNTEDIKEGRKAFAERRKPKFKGR